MKRHVPGGACGFVLFDKPRGPSSHQALSVLKKTFGTGRIGHAGTLDPLATGLLVCAVGKATRLLQEVEAEEKEYIFAVRLGMATDSLDFGGSILESRDVPGAESIDWDAVLPEFIGEQDQVPPAISAVRVDGRHAYSLARQGQNVELPARRVNVLALSRIELPGFAPERDPVFRVRCSRGTYVRSLARDFGIRLGLPTCVSALRRTAIGAKRLPDLPPSESAEVFPLTPVAEVFSDWASFNIDAARHEDLRYGRPIASPLELPDAERVLVLHDGTAVAAGRVVHGTFRLTVLFDEAIT